MKAYWIIIYSTLIIGRHFLYVIIWTSHKWNENWNPFFCSPFIESICRWTLNMLKLLTGLFHFGFIFIQHRKKSDKWKHIRSFWIECYIVIHEKYYYGNESKHFCLIPISHSKDNEWNVLTIHWFDVSH